MHCKSFVCLLGVAVAQAIGVTILADTNRDGKIDVKTDGQNKATWTNERGAIFLPNIVDTDGRCSANININTADNKLETCHDASDNVLRNSNYLAPLKVLPVSGLATDAKGHFTVTNAAKVRLFRKTSKGWSYVDGCTSFTAADLAAGLDLGIDGRDIRRPSGWDGRTNVQFSVVSDGKEYKDTVTLRVAPVLTHHHAQSVEYVLMHNTKKADGYDDYWTETVGGVTNATAWAGIKGGLKQAFSECDRWSQDFIEPGYASMPGPNGLVYLHIIIRSFQSDRESGRQAFSLRSSNTGAVQWLMNGYSQDSGGNIETIPPYSNNGKHWPAGRVISGRQEKFLPNAFAFFKAQETQDALELDTSWLLVGHVDEFIQFLPVKTNRGWAIMVDDPKLGLEFFKNLKAQGHGDLNWLSRKFNTAYPKSYPKTITDLLAMNNLEEYTKLASDKIEANLNILKKETGITDAEIYRLPGLYYLWLNDKSPHDKAVAKAMASNSSDGGNAGDIADEDWQSSKSVAQVPALNALQAGGGRAEDSLQVRAEQVNLIAIGPAIINGIVLSDKHYAAPNPFGPIVSGVDVIQKNALDTYKKLGYDVRFVDDWETLHTYNGEIHCGSNTVRTPKGTWW
ncbi:hypothetical protein VHEMI08256 [[Torrubiella] hemipterigena]|uniref:Protein-arginine deiminase C-terminal domain-containing protein n=1 Tax=[Torrubiella] hemipterigena TaxID=1531966 RepID=A0A0A1TPE5_9HYPO|nr:hypothetical protein VHEMI08256 [[Torrubiella] hemipterigena]